MTTGYDELLDAVTDDGIDVELDKKYYANIGDAQELCSDAAEIIHDLRAKSDDLLALLEDAFDFIKDGPAPTLEQKIGAYLQDEREQQEAKANLAAAIKAQEQQQ